MNISLNWLKEFVSLSNISSEEIKDRLTAHTVEVEKIIKQKEQYQNIVVAEILEIKKHPQADKLQLVLVDAGEKENLKVVCGAFNISCGQLVPLAKIGAILPNGLEIKKAEIRGEESNGMLCAEDELGLGSNHDGIMILSSQAKKGELLADYLELNEVVLEIDNKSISNRPDLWSHYGIARELAILFNKKLDDYSTKEIKIKKDNKKEKTKLEVKIEVKNLCQKYLALKIENIKIEDSPKWLKNRLTSLGVKPINNIVDITNYIMFETGQPLHAFDGENIKKIIIKKATKNEKIMGLDEGEKKLEEDDLVISSDKETIAIAGVIGAKNSQINNTTSTIIIESANFDAVSVRKTAQRLNTRTDAAMRFEKGLDPNLCKIAINKAGEMIKKISPSANFNHEIIETGDFVEENKIITLDLDWADKLIGQKIDRKEIKKILESLGLKIEKNKNLKKNEDKSWAEEWDIKIPSWRTKDLSIKEDLIEEIIRIYGYDNIKSSSPKGEIIPPEKDKELELIKKIKKILALSYKMNEVYNYSFVSEEQLLKLNLDPKTYLQLLNPLSTQHTLLRQTMTTHLLSNVKTNQAKYNKIALFEIGNVFLNISGDLNKDETLLNNLPYQEKKIGLILAENTNEKFKNLKNIIFNAIEEISEGAELKFLPTESIIDWADQNEKCLLMLNDKEIGFLATISKEVLNKNGIKKEVSALEISLKSLLSALSNLETKQYQEIPKFPPINRDLAFVIDEKIFYNDIRQEIKDFNPLIKRVDLFDVYSGKNLEANKKSLAFHVIYQSGEKTLTNESVDKIEAELIKLLESKFNAQIRNF
ncbi:MAG: phenylalanine--tRNA ligase subunit beta [Patescibacteria group bacterium]|jgi:phenylalanyl-tRNA synthetase beta chain